MLPSAIGYSAIRNPQSEIETGGVDDLPRNVAGEFQ
jgi:hypothetical protein